MIKLRSRNNTSVTSTSSSNLLSQQQEQTQESNDQKTQNINNNEAVLLYSPAEALKVTELTNIMPVSSDSSSTTELTSKKTLSWFAIKAIIIASIGGILFGYDLGVISGALPQLTIEFNLSTQEKESVVSFLYIGGALGSIVGGHVCDALGRKTTILLTDVIFILGASLVCFATNYSMVLLGRIIIGFGVSTSGIADVAYLHEISPSKHYRGALISCNEACIALGFLCSYSAGYYISLLFPQHGWRMMFGLSCILAVAQFIGMIWMPESPKWLALKGRMEDSYKVKKLIGISDDPSDEHHDDNAHEDYTTVYEEDDDDESLLVQNHKTGGPIPNSALSYSSIQKDVPQAIQTKSSLSCLYNIIQSYLMEFVPLLPQSIIAIFLAIAQQFSGHPNVLNFAPEIFSNAGFYNDFALASTLLLGLVKFFVTVFVILKIEFIGRRKLLLLGVFTIMMSHLILATSFRHHYLQNDTQQEQNLLAVLGTMGVVMGYSISFGPLTWLFTSEMFPTKIRGRALGISTILSNCAASIVSFTFLSIQSKFGKHVPFCIYFIISFFTLIFCLCAIPDTGNKDPDRIDAELRQMYFWRKFMSCFTTCRRNTLKKGDHPPVELISPVLVA